MKEYIYKKMYEIENAHWWFKAKKHIIINIIKDIILPRSDKKIEIADVGCGVGLLLDSLSAYGKCTGIVFSNQAIEFCQKSFDGELIQVDIGKDLAVNKTFDLVVASDLIEHIDNDNIAIKNIYNLLKKGGYAVITVPAFQFLWSQHDVNNMHYRRYDLKTLKDLIKTTKFNICYLSYYNFFLFLPALIVRISKKILNFDKSSNLELSIPKGFINNILFKIFSTESKLINKGKKFPFGLSLITILKKI